MPSSTTPPICSGLRSWFYCLVLRDDYSSVKLNDHRYVYVFVRVDIPIQHQMAQACHAAHEAGKEFPVIIDDPDSMIVLQVENQEALNRAADLLHENGIGLVKFWEPEPRWNYGYTAFGTEPLKNSQRHLLNGYKLWSPIYQKKSSRMNSRRNFSHIDRI